MTVAQMRTLAATGALDGRFAAVAGYWMQYALPCPFQPHAAPISGFCAGGAFSDSLADVSSYTGSPHPTPLVMPETSNSNLLQTAVANGPAAVVFVVHAADSRYWQCPSSDRNDCAQNLVIDRVAWVNGQEAVLESPNPNLIASGEQLVMAFQVPATSMNDVDPRFNGEADGQVWYGRTAYGQPDAYGTTAGVTREVSVATSAIVDERTLAVSDKYLPGRVVLDVSQSGLQPENTTAQFAIVDGATDVVSGDLGMQTPPITIYAATYTLKASLAATTCSEQIAVAAGSDVTFFAKFSKNSCRWQPTDALPS